MTFVIIREAVVAALPDYSGVREQGRERGRQGGGVNWAERGWYVAF